ALDVPEVAAHLGDHGVASGEADLGVARVDGVGAGGDAGAHEDSWEMVFGRPWAGALGAPLVRIIVDGLSIPQVEPSTSLECAHPLPCPRTCGSVGVGAATAAPHRTQGARMGIFDSAKDKAAELNEQHGDKIEEHSDAGLDKAGEFAEGKGVGAE